MNRLLDNDLYKFTMQQVAYRYFSDTQVEYKFVCRSGVDLRPYRAEIEKSIGLYIKSCSTDRNLEPLRNLRFMQLGYLSFLEDFTLKEKFVKVSEENGQLSIRITGDWVSTILLEVPILSIVSEIYMKSKAKELNVDLYQEAHIRLQSKIDLYKTEGMSFLFADFGTRRRIDFRWHEELVRTLSQELPSAFIGSSNVALSSRYGVKSVGTMAHEFIMLGQGVTQTRLSNSQAYMLQKWADSYRGDLGIALTDTISMDAFLNDYDAYFSKLFDGCRHDSGDPIIWGEKLIAHYQKYGIDPLSKTAVFSDGLDFQEAHRIHQHFNGRIKTMFGIGTNLSNDCGVKPLSIVIKLVEVNGHPVAKLSDEPSKTICEDIQFLEYLKKVFDYKIDAQRDKGDIS